MTQRLHFSRIALTAALLVAVFGLMGAIPATAAETWTIDPAHTKVSFTVDHFFTPVEGSFDQFDVSLVYDPQNPAASKVTAKIPVGSVDTANTKRDDHLRSADWFEVAEHPYMTFESSSVRGVGEGRLVAVGTLTIKGISHQVTLPIEILGVRDIPEEMQPMVGAKQVASFRATASLDRNDYEVGVGSWAGTMVVGDTVNIEILAEAHRN